MSSTLASLKPTSAKISSAAPRILRWVSEPRSPTSGLLPKGGRRTMLVPSISPNLTVLSLRLRGSRMQVDDLILVSVDDHVVEPPDLFEGRLSKKAAEIAPKVESQEDGRDVWMFQGSPLPNVGLNAVAGR